MNGFKEYTVKDVISLVIDYRGKTPKKLGGDWSESGYRALSAKNVKTGKIVQPDTIRFVSKEMYNKWMKDEVDRGDIFITSEAPFGQIYYWDSDEKIVLSQRLFAIRAKEEFYDKYIYFYMTTPQFQAELENRSTGTTVTGLRQPELLKSKIIAPDYNNQVKIADFLYEIEKKININEAINRNLLNQITTIYQEWYVEFGTYNHTEFVDVEGRKIPLGWSFKKLGNICDSISKKHKFDKDQLIFLNTGDVTDGQYSHENYLDISGMPGQAKKLIKKDDILYSEIRPVNRHFAYVNFDAEDYVVSTKLMVIRAKEVNARRLYQYLTSQNIIDELQLEAESRSGTFPQIRFENISNLKILIATEEIENEFSEILEDIYKQIDSSVKENNKLIELRDVLLPELMSGKLNVLNLNV